MYIAGGDDIDEKFQRHYKHLIGKAKTSDISKLAKLRYPDSPLYQQVTYASANLGYTQHDRVKGT
jgi:hypothetical protein